MTSSTTAETPRLDSYDEFWPHYMRAHRKPWNRWMHFTGTLLALLCIVAAIVLRRPLLLLAAPVIGYGFAWIGHFGIEGNTPATFGHPVWSMRSDFLMVFLMLTGRMGRELRRLDDRSSD